MDKLRQDFTFGLRILLQKPWMSFAAILGLSLGMALVITVFSVLYGVFLKPLPLPKPERLAFFLNEGGTGMEAVYTLPFTGLEGLRDKADQLEALCGLYSGTITVSGEDFEPKRLNGAFVSTDFHEVLGVQPILGRALNAADALPGTPPRLLLAHRTWQENYLGDPGILRRKLRINSEEGEIIGVMPPGFAFPNQEEAWMMVREDDPHLARYWVFPFGRLSSSADHTGATQQVNGLLEEFWQTSFQELKPEKPVTLSPRMFRMNSESVRWFWAFSLGSSLILLLACAQVANLLLAQAAGRSREFAIRSALGATRRRLILQMLHESAILAFLGGMGGLILAAWLIEDANEATRRLQQPYFVSFSLNAPVVVFSLVMSFLVALVSGLGPALQSTRTNLVTRLSDLATTLTSVRLRRLSAVLAVFQIALACALMVAAGLTLRSVSALQTVDFGYEPSDILTMRVGLFDQDYPQAEDRLRFFDQLIAELESIEGVEGAAASSWLSLMGNYRTYYTVAPSDSNEPPPLKPEDPKAWQQVAFEAVSDGYFAAMGVDLLAGHSFAGHPQLPDGHHPVIINQSFARQHWPGQDPLGKTFRHYASTGKVDQSKLVTVIGVVPDLRVDGLLRKDSESACIYISLQAWPERFMTILVRATDKAPGAYLSDIKQKVYGLDPHLPLYFVQTMEEFFLSTAIWHRVTAGIFVTLGLIAMLLAALGVYSVMAFSIGQRRREIGIRLALGADRRAIRDLLLRQSLGQLAAGLVVGLGLAFLLAQNLEPVLYGISPGDPPTFLISAGVVIAAALACILIPANRVIRSNPLLAIRSQ